MTIAIPPVPATPLVRPRRQTAASMATTDADHVPDVGNMVETVADPAMPVESTAADGPKEFVAAVTQRLIKERRWRDVEPLKNAMIKEARAKGMTRPDAQLWAYGEVDRLYPPLPKVTDDTDNAGPGVSSEGNASSDGEPSDGPSAAHARGPIEANGTERVTPCQPPSPESARLQGLGDVPADWPALPANASLAAEIGWVQANRLYVVEERGPTTIVHLARAHEPAPSRAAIGWLETSIRSYAKFVDVVSKCLGTASDEAEQVRRERMAIEDIRSLLAEMHED